MNAQSCNGIIEKGGFSFAEWVSKHRKFFEAVFRDLKKKQKELAQVCKKSVVNHSPQVMFFLKRWSSLENGVEEECKKMWH